MKRHLTNAIYGALDYASYPVGMLVVSPIILRRLGSAEYGLWMVSTALISAGGIIAAGFGDAGIQRIAGLRGAARFDQVRETVRSLFNMHLLFGCMIALIVWVSAPYAALRIASAGGTSVPVCLFCLRIASLVILLRAVEAVSVATQRAFEEYRKTVQISTVVRFATLGCAAVLAMLHHHVESVMVTTAAIFAIGTVWQYRHLQVLLNGFSLWGTVSWKEVCALFASGKYVWLQAFGSVLFRQFDRILLGLSLGAIVVAPYAISIQLAEPLFGLTASGLSFFFPYLSSRAQGQNMSALRVSVRKAMLCNLLLVTAGTALLLGFGERFLHLWMGDAITRKVMPVFPMIVIGAALSGLSVTGTYALQALGRFRVTAMLGITSRSALFLLMFYLLHHYGLRGLAFARLCYGATMLLVYVPLLYELNFLRRHTRDEKPVLQFAELQERARL